MSNIDTVKKSVIAIVIMAITLSGCCSNSEKQKEIVRKPVIYMYGAQDETKVDVCIGVDSGDIDFVYPEDNDGSWHCTVDTQGNISTKIKYNEETEEYEDTIDSRYLFWEGRLDISENKWQYCVSKDDLVEFFREELTSRGLVDNEIADFITYWVPIMLNEQYGYFLIDFNSNYYESVRYGFQIEEFDEEKIVTKWEPDTLIRVFMAYQNVESKQNVIYEEKISTPERKGFTVVEWGGAETYRG